LGEFDGRPSVLQQRIKHSVVVERGVIEQRGSHGQHSGSFEVKSEALDTKAIKEEGYQLQRLCGGREMLDQQ
jgi:hypothetical protein